MPGFDIEGGVWLALVRAVSVAGCLSVLGCVVFRLVVLPPALAPDRRWLALIRASVAAALLGGGLWLALVSFEMAGTTDLAAVRQVLLLTRFGHVLAARLALLAVVPIVLGPAPPTPRLAIAALLAAAAVGLQSLLGHAASMGWQEKWLILSVLLHVLAAGLWLGQLLPLWSFVSAAPPAVARQVLDRFSPLALACVVMLAGTAALQATVLVGGLPQLLGTAYGWTALAKLGLLGTLTAVAAINRFRLMPRLSAETAETARQTLCLAILVETVLGVGVILAAAVLSSLPPGMHAQLIGSL